MAGKKFTQSDAARRLVKKLPEASTRTLARRLAKELNIPFENARAAVKYVRGQSGEKKRRMVKDKSSFVPRKTAPVVPSMPPSLKDSWEEYDLGNSIKIAVLSDIHVPYHDERALAEAVNFCKKRKPDVVLLNGDYGDWYSLSKYQKNPGKRNFKRELKLQIQGLEWIRHQFKSAKIVFKAGNHDERWDHWLWNFAPEITNLHQTRLKSILKLKKFGIDYVGDQRPIKAGDLSIFHGHELPKGIASPVNVARGVFVKTYDTVMVGHHHRTSTHVEGDWKHREVSCWSTGCLCELTPEYARINKFNLGFAFVTVLQDNAVDVENYRMDLEYNIRRA
jgi:predicted phosphodiesterase